ncbi:MAG: flavodoxin-dependent (E)-4-hydroxy-3-methylbut-2-enyl-diphosphate synthase [Clostridia bacterium]|nr:flavodoxin-dependent (E)-4-hydroxy-3-methylbut-2-enyl-diphosphate synthase [Clostridia bacterium]
MDYNLIRRKTKKIKVGNLFIGCDAPVSVQSMLNTDGADAEACILQAKRLEEAGCDIIRMSVPDISCVKTFFAMKNAGIKAPLVADIHFDFKLAIESAFAGADKIRINPGNIGGDENVRQLVYACKKNNIPIRIGVNGGSLEKDILQKFGSPTPDALAESALRHAALLEKFDFDDIVISIKSSSPFVMAKACGKVAESCEYPLHIGVTEAGSGEEAIIKSSVGIGSLLLDGIGDTVRVSLTDDPVKEVKAARIILSSLGLLEGGSVDVISCPTCGRTKIDLIPICESLKTRFAGLDTHGKNIKVAVMGCVVNGPGEAREADVGIAGGDGCAVLISHGEIVGKIPEEKIADVLFDEVVKLIDGR